MNIQKGVKIEFNITDYNIILDADKNDYGHAKVTIKINRKDFFDCAALVYLPSKPNKQIHIFICE